MHVPSSTLAHSLSLSLSLAATAAAAAAPVVTAAVIVAGIADTFFYVCMVQGWLRIYPVANP